MKQVIKVIIVDDEAYARQHVAQLLEGYEDFQLVQICSDGYEALEAIQLHQPDLLFLDIQMPELSGFDVIRKMEVEKPPYIIFTTAYVEYAVQAFEVSALDYLLKPLKETRFQEAIEKARSLLHQTDSQEIQSKLQTLLSLIPTAQSKTYLKRISVRHAGSIQVIPVHEILWIEADNQYVQIHSKEAKHLLRSSLNQLEERLDPAEFYRVHRSALVKIDAIKELEPYFKGDYMIKLSGGIKVKLARNRVAALKELLGW